MKKNSSHFLNILFSLIAVLFFISVFSCNKSNEDVSLDKWPFENYFKAGNYLETTNTDAYSYIKHYNLTVSIN